MSSQAGDVESVVSAVKWIGIVLGVAAVVSVAVVVYMCCYRKNSTTQSELMDGLLRRDQLEETELEDEGKGWQCVVCGLANSAKRKTCLMCGTSIGFLMTGELGRRKSSRMLLRNNSRGITGADVAGGAGEDEDIEALRSRQRALFKRRMNMMAARKNLSQRQRGAFRRRLWQRKQLSDGKFHWVRQNSTGVVDPVPELQAGDAAQPALPSTAEAKSLAGPNGESVSDYHNLRSQGFVSMYDASGRLTWTKADEVSIDMESFDKMRTGLEKMDFEGVMALSFRMKKQWFLVQLSRIATPVTEAVAKLTVTRERIIQQSLQLAEVAPDALHAYLKITFEEPEERAKLLQFVTGTSRVPVEGFRGLMSSSGIIHQFTIQFVPRGKEKSDLFPKAHTCFNRLDLPMYRDMEELETYLTMVSQMEVFGFGLE
ncbi:hypothetical protein PC118_g9187 [Phytophthora cactorum]|uniref:HECT-type E3 ubiquitin transferase n=1 Tax=Phytophthora cactorum TaxID=29920 RepID=A0A8T1G0K6_9STRA|nr:hypothetical protein PC118_g9187 [Phytophthora cactorum]